MLTYSFTKKRLFIILISLVLTIALPRLLILGDYPYTDEGSYAYLAQLIFHSSFNADLLPQVLRYEIYPTLFSWVFSLDTNQFIILRFIDLLFAMTTGYLIFKIIFSSSGNFLFSFILSSILNYTINLPLFINSGFKNSIFFSLTFLLSSILILNKPLKQSLDFYIVGLLLAMAILSREPFVIYFLPISIFIYFRYGILKFKDYFIAFVIACFSITLIILLIRNQSPYDLVSSYINMRNVYSVMNVDLMSLFLQSFKVVIEEAKFIFLLSCLMIVVGIMDFKKINNFDQLLLFFSLFVLSFIEPLLKAGFPYHFILAIIFMVLISGSIVKNFTNKSFIINVLMSFTFVAFLLTYFDKINSTIHLFKSVYYENVNDIKNWGPISLQQSQYLTIAQYIRESSNNDDRIIISGSMYPLFPLAGRLPSSHEFSDLNVMFARLDYNSSLLKDEIHELKPKLIFVSDRVDFYGTDQIRNIIKEMPDYKLFRTIKNDTSKHYGNFSGQLYIKSK